MNNPLDSAFMDGPEFQSLLIECMEALQRGESIDRVELREKFPKYADDLDKYLDVLNVLEKFSSGLGGLNSSSNLYEATVTRNSRGAIELSENDVIRYIGEYEVLEEIARGGMGVVFKARQASLKRIVALKMILSGRLADAAEIERFRREAQAASRLQHPNIVPVHEIGEHEGRQYFTMDYVDGHSLGQEIREESLPPNRAASLMKTIADAVQFAHGKDTLHRDLKPANILITNDDQPRVTDFGLAKILDEVDDESRADLTASGQILGTPSYMSPEQAEGKQSLIGPATDIYSLGAILYACLTGRAPFVADSPVDTLMQVINKEPVSPRQLNPSVPQDLETICLKCLNKEPHKRYGTAQELADDLQRFLTGRPVLARPIGRVARTTRWAKRNPVVASLMCLVAISLVSGTAISLYFAVEANQRADSEQKVKVRQIELLAETKELAGDLKESLDRETKLKGEALDSQAVAERNLNISERTLYALQLSRSFEQWRFQPQESRDGLLDETRCPPHLQDFSWRFLTHLTYRLVRTYPGYSAAAASIAVSPDGKLIASSAFQSKIKICSRERGMSWELDRGLVPGDRPENRDSHLVFLPDNRTLVSGSDNSVVTLWDALAGKFLNEVGNGEAVQALAVSPDGQWIATGGQKQIRIFRTSDLKRIKEFAIPATELVFSLDQKTLIAGSGRSVVFLSLDSDEQSSWEEHEKEITGLAISPDGQLLASYDESILMVRNLMNGEILYRIKESPRIEIRNVQFSPQGDTFATSTSNSPVKLWKTENGEALGAVTTHDRFGTKNAMAFLPDAPQLLTSGNTPEANLSLWNLPVIDPAKTIQQTTKWMTLSPDSDLLATTDRSSIQIWDTRTKEVIDTWTPEDTDQIEGKVGHLQFLPGSKQLLSMHEKNLVVLWDLDTKRLVRKFENLGSGRAFAYDPVHGRIALNGSDERLSVRDFETGEELMSIDKSRWNLQAVSFSPNGEWLAFGDGPAPFPDGTTSSPVQLRNLKTGESLSLDGHPRLSIDDVVFSPDGKTVVSVGIDGIIWELPSGKMRARLEEHQSAINSVDFTTDGRTLVTGSSDKTVRLWDPVTGELRLTLGSHPHYVTAVEFNHDGTHLVSCSYDGQVKFWEAPILTESVAHP